MNTLALTAREPIRFKHSLAWLVLLAPIFFLSYGWANQLAASRDVTASIVFGWERIIPFLPWTIIPYWSIDLMYGLSFLALRSPREVNHHGLRLLSAQLISVAFFVAFPLRFSADKPVTEGLFGALFDALAGFDLPYNQAPSLHISLLVIIWWSLIRHASPGRRWLWHGWALLVAGSVLTTWQHHFFDVPTGLLVGLFTLWLWPDQGDSPMLKRIETSAPNRRLSLFYLLGASLCVLAASQGGWALWAIWPAVSLALVAYIYARAGTAGFQKQNGRQSMPVRWLLAPYRLGAWINSRAWTHKQPEPDQITDQIWIGRIPSRSELAASGFDAVLDLTSEFNTPNNLRHSESVPMLDLCTPDIETLRLAARSLETIRQNGHRVLVCCALGYSRSALTLAAWLLQSGECDSVNAAIMRIKARRPGVVLTDAQRQLLKEIKDESKG
jgi:protein-tyrosine phosphatase